MFKRRKALRAHTNEMLEELYNKGRLILPHTDLLIPFVTSLQLYMEDGYILYQGYSVHPFDVNYSGEGLRKCGDILTKRQFHRLCCKWYKWKKKHHG
jgi:hypothetical protein